MFELENSYFDITSRRKMSLISALDILIKSCSFLMWKSQNQSSK